MDSAARCLEIRAHAGPFTGYPFCRLRSRASVPLKSLWEEFLDIPSHRHGRQGALHRDLADTLYHFRRPEWSCISLIQAFENVLKR